MQGSPRAVAGEMRRVAKQMVQLPALRLLAKPFFRYRFRRGHANDEAIRYYGNYPSFAHAKAQAPQTLPGDFDTQAAGSLYRGMLDRVKATDYPVLYWLSRLLNAAQCRVFDLGGHIGIGYYAYGRYLEYPVGLRWLVHDVPAVMAAGREWALEHDPERRLAFAGSPDEVDGCDLLISSGALQYLDYTLPELLRRTAHPPAHVLVNRVPMHPSRGYFTLQNFGIAVCPYRVMALPAFITDMETAGYVLLDHWRHNRTLQVPFEPACAIDSYHGFCFKRE